MTERLELRLVKAHCIEETDADGSIWGVGSDWGSDEMRLSGTAINAAGQTYALPILDIGSFDDGKWRTYSPPLVCASFDLDVAAGWPKGNIAMLILAEGDEGGFGDVVRKLASATEKEVATYLGTAVGTTIGTAIGTPGGPVTMAVGAAVGLAVGATFGWIKKGFKDDLFNTQTITCNVLAPDESVRSETTLEWKGHGGRYKLFFEWKKPGISPIQKKYTEVIQSNPWIGKPIIQESLCPDGVGHYQHYEGGASIYWHPDTGAHLIYGLIRAKWEALGWENSPVGYPVTDEADAGSGHGSRFNNFQNGTIIWKHGAPEAFAVYGAIYGKWGEHSWDSGPLGFPLTDEADAPNGGRYNRFEGGSIYWTPETGAYVQNA